MRTHWRFPLPNCFGHVDYYSYFGNRQFVCNICTHRTTINSSSRSSNWNDGISIPILMLMPHASAFVYFKSTATATATVRVRKEARKKKMSEKPSPDELLWLLIVIVCLFFRICARTRFRHYDDDDDLFIGILFFVRCRCPVARKITISFKSMVRIILNHNELIASFIKMQNEREKEGERAAPAPENEEN